MNHPTQSPAFDPGSFRDRDGRIFYRDSEVLRAISAGALSEWDSLSATRFFPRLMEEGRVVRTARLEEAPPDGWAAVLRHDRVPFVSYPYEWSFSMLKDAALLQLEVLKQAVNEGFTLKDCSAFNFQWNGAQPVFIDILSFRKLQAGEVWAGYRQFCQMFLYPLMLQAYRHISFHSRLRGDVDGISPMEMERILSWTSRFKPGVFTHVYLQSKLQERMSATQRNLRVELRDAGFNREMILANIGSIAGVVRKLNWNPSRSEWAHYTCTTSYSEQDAAAKEKFVREVVSSRTWPLVWDLGCNTGVFSRMAAEHAGYVVAMDGDHLVVDRLYTSLVQDNVRNVLPLVMNLSDASPGLGWRGAERKPLTGRGAPDLILSLALIHHMVISANIPVKDFVDWLADQGSALLIEFVTREDPMVQKLLLNKEDQYADYTVEFFEQCLRARYRTLRREALPSGMRILYFAER